MWFTGTHTREAIELAEAWGFKVRTMKGFTSGKVQPTGRAAYQQSTSGRACGGFLRLPRPAERTNTHERRELHPSQYRRPANRRRGNGLERKCASIKQVIYSPLGEHSQKPAEVRLRLEKLYGDVPRIELFSRCGAPGWDHWGESVSITSC